ncbi:MAG: F0F1 ATP synthase subunit epsilon [Candidatus Kinetoplastibacterium crithidii]|nr:MAG: F0F1 ATP synthase subunit epsilon [Candidatus Kinetoplastibacterium crithidii]
MAKLMYVDIVSVTESMYAGQASFVLLPANSGSIGILPGHTPLISLVRPGVIKIVDEHGKEHNIFVAGGILEIQPNEITVLTDTAIRASNLDEARATEARKRAEETLRNAKNKSDIAVVEAELNVLVAQTRAARMYGSNNSNKY